VSEEPIGFSLVDVDELEVEIEKLVAGGEGLVRYRGVPIFVPRSAPGDRLLVRLVERRPDYGRAEIVELLVAGPGRRTPPCPYYAACGGCDLQHLDDSVQLRLKVQAALETLARLGGVRLEQAPTLLVAETWGYRLRTQLHTEAVGERVIVGHHARRSNQLVAVDRCPVLVPELERELASLPQRLAAGAPNRLDLATGSDGRLTVSPRLEGLPAGEVALEVAGFTYSYDARVFFQSHRGLLGQLIEAAVGDATGEQAYDLFGGVGLFALPLAKRYQRVTSIDGDRIATRFARNNAKRNGLPNVEVLAQAVETWIPQLPPAVERVIVDPPRAGLAPGVRKHLLAKLPRRLTYVSCHPASLARDLRALLAAYRIESVTFADLFPQTGHLETIVQLVTEAPIPEPAPAPPPVAERPRRPAPPSRGRGGGRDRDPWGARRGGKKPPPRRRST
jgi:23S rRNA (uracil1939-C5)-methyltransferase